MDVFRGNTSDEATTVAYSLPMVMNNYTLVNRAGGSVSFNVYMIKDEIPISVGQGSINSGAFATDIVPRLVRKDELIKLVTTGSTDYSFELDNTQPPI